MKENVERSSKNCRKILIFLLLFTIPLLNGCYGITELNDRVIVSLVGLDLLENGKVEVTMGLIDTRLIEIQEARSLHVYSFQGETIFDAIRIAIMEIGKQPMWPYIKAVIFGPSFQENDIEPLLDFFNRNNEIQPNPYILFSPEPARDIVNMQVDLANIPAVIVEQQIEHQLLVSYTPEVTLYQISEMMYSLDEVGYASIIKREKPQNVHKVEGTAVIKDGKWIGSLNRMETRGSLWVQGAVKSGITVVPYEQGKIALEIVEKTKAGITPILKDNQLSIRIDIAAKASLGELMTVVELDNEEMIEKINKLAEKEITKEIEASFARTKKWKTDIYGIDRSVHKKYPKYWRSNRENWQDIFSNLPIEINVDVNVKKMGLFNTFK